MPARGKAGLPSRPMFAGLALILLAIVPPSTPGFDGTAMYAVTDGLIHGTLHVPCAFGVPGPGGCVSAYYPLLSFVMVPFALVGRALGALAGLPLRAMGELVALAVPALSVAGAAALCAALAQRLGADRRRALLAGVAFALGTETLTYARTLFAEPLGALCLAAAVWGVLSGARRIGLAGCALCVLAKPQLGLAVLAIALALALCDRRRRPALDVLGALSVGVGLYLLYNLARVGDPLDFSRRAGELVSGSSDPHDPAVLGLVKQAGVLLVSPNYGLLWYSPVVILGAAALWRARRDRTACVCLAAAAGVLLIYLPSPRGPTAARAYDAADRASSTGPSLRTTSVSRSG